MTSPFSMIIPSVSSLSFIFLSMLLLLSISFLSSFRNQSVGMILKTWTKVFPRWLIFISSGVLFVSGSFFSAVSISLLPLSVISFHFPVLGVGLSFSFWAVITLLGSQARSLAYKKEYLGDSTLSAGWVLMSIFIESMSRGARAVTLGARISVNIMMGGILHSVLGETSSGWGMFGLTVLEILVVFIQVYVFILLLCFYSAELS